MKVLENYCQVRGQQFSKRLKVGCMQEFEYIYIQIEIGRVGL